MKNVIHTIKTTIIISFLNVSVVFSQQPIENQLETVYLNHNYPEETVYVNNFSPLNRRLIASNKIHFPTEIRKARKTKTELFFLSKRSKLKISTKEYLKIIRKGANRNTNIQSFIYFLNSKLPEITNQLIQDNNLEELFIISRKNTFSGKIDALPVVL